MSNKKQPGYLVDAKRLPDQYPTHRIAAAFWEQLGRTVATFGFLEETLGKAIFSLSATRRYHESEIDQAYEELFPKIERALSDPLGNLIDSYASALKSHSDPSFDNPDVLIDDLRAAARFRNIICHGSWGVPDEHGKSIPFYVTRKLEVCESALGVEDLKQTQDHVVELISAVINSVTHMGWCFPGASGPGVPIFPQKTD